VSEAVPDCRAQLSAIDLSSLAGFIESRTVSVVVEVRELVAPLCQNAQRILEESDNDQEAADSWKIPIETTLALLSRVELVVAAILRCKLRGVQGHSRLDRVGQRVQEVLNLVRLLPELIEWTRVVRGAIVPSSVTERALVSQVVARCAPYLRHNCGRKQKRGTG
jgi:hypothetical protein